MIFVYDAEDKFTIINCKISLSEFIEPLGTLLNKISCFSLENFQNSVSECDINSTLEKMKTILKGSLYNRSLLKFHDICHFFL